MQRQLHILSGGAARAVAEGLAEELQARTGCGITGSYGAVGAMRDLLLAGQPCDVLILTRALIDELMCQGHAVAGSARHLGRVKTAIAVRSGDPVPKVESPEQLRQALLEAPSIWFPDPQRATAGIHFANVLDKLGIRSRVQSRLRTWPNGATAMGQMAQTDEAGAIGCTQVTEILYTPGVHLVAPLPLEFELATVYTAAVASKAVEPQAAHLLVEMLGGPHSVSLRQRGGFETD
jgi:molybdate transport system substrate-binding protein